MALSAEEIATYRDRYAIGDDIAEIKVWKTESDDEAHSSLLYFTDDACSAFTGDKLIVIGVGEDEDGTLLPWPTITDVDGVWTEFTGGEE
jgi:hypothetical protein|tara:strand:+ start:2293 stop:2562 length:270 start_codon:yes stop_codon:yes gene_type:complete